MYFVILSGFLAQRPLKLCKPLALNVSWSNISQLNCVWREEFGFELGSCLLNLIVFILWSPLLLVEETERCCSAVTSSS